MTNLVMHIHAYLCIFKHDQSMTMTNLPSIRNKRAALVGRTAIKPLFKPKPGPARSRSTSLVNLKRRNLEILEIQVAFSSGP